MLQQLLTHLQQQRDSRLPLHRSSSCLPKISRCAPGLTCQIVQWLRRNRAVVPVGMGATQHTYHWHSLHPPAATRAPTHATQAPSGQLLPINVLHPPAPADVYRCIGCTKPECQVCAVPPLPHGPTTVP